jgi:hypothetical protein
MVSATAGWLLTNAADVEVSLSHWQCLPGYLCVCMPVCVRSECLYACACVFVCLHTRTPTHARVST